MSALRHAVSGSQTGADESGFLRLDRNENPYGASLLVQESLSIYEGFARRPGPLPRSLSRALARYTGRLEGSLYLAESPVELLSRVLGMLAEPGDPILAYAPYGEALRRAARWARVPVTDVARVDGTMRAAEALRSRPSPACVVYVGSPNDPTGDVASPQEIVALLRTGVTVIADETYAEFTDRRLGPLGREFPNLVSVRSFAPWAGLWGVPVSYAVASPELVGRLGAAWPQEELSAPARIAAGASLDDQALLASRVRRIRLERARLFRRLRKLNFVEPAPSHGPFIPCAVTRGTAARVVSLLEGEGALVHDCAPEGLPEHVRISVGTPEQTDELFAAMCRIAAPL